MQQLLRIIMKPAKIFVPLLLIFVLLISGCTIVESGNVGIVSSFGKVQASPVEPGISFIFPGLRDISQLSIRTIALPEEFTSLTKDSQKIIVAATATFSIAPQAAPQAYIQIGRNVQTIQATVVQPVLLSAVKNVISQYAMTFIIENQAIVATEIRVDIIKQLQQAGYINFQDFNVTGFILDPDVQKAVEQKQIAIQEQERKKTELVTAGIEAERLKALDSALTERILMKQAIDKWNGNSLVPPTATGQSNILLSK